MKLALLLCAAALASAPGCAVFPPAGTGHRQTRTELYFGSAKPGGGAVTEGEWQAFLKGEITPRFPDGLTWIDATGQWRTRRGEIIREKTRLLVLIHPPTREAQARIDTIRRLYQRRFSQESVLKVTTPVKAAF